MQEVHVRAVDHGAELRKAVQSRLGRAPVITAPPVLRQLLEVSQRHASAPADIGELLRPPGVGQPALEVVELRLRDIDAEGLHWSPDGPVTAATAMDFLLRFGL